MIVNNTPVETHYVGRVPLLVKREDLCAPYPGPMFSKMRGVYAHIQNRPEKFIGVLDTLHSKAGWCVSYVCRALGKQAVNFWPAYKNDGWDPLIKNYPRVQQRESASLGATMRVMKAGRSAILYHGAKKHMRDIYGEEGYMMPNALKLPESITENAAEAFRTCNLTIAGGDYAPDLPNEGTLVISISSGTVAAGVLKGFKEAGLLDRYDVILHMGYSRSIDAARAYMEEASGLTLDPKRVRFVDEGYGYADKVNIETPFPSNPHYDAKAWKWLTQTDNLLGLADRPIVFWNIGA